MRVCVCVCESESQGIYFCLCILTVSVRMCVRDIRDGKSCLCLTLCQSDCVCVVRPRKQAVILEKQNSLQTPQMLLICMQLREMPSHLPAHQKTLTNILLSIPIKPPLIHTYGERQSDIYQQTNNKCLMQSETL